MHLSFALQSILAAAFPVRAILGITATSLCQGSGAGDGAGDTCGLLGMSNCTSRSGIVSESRSMERGLICTLSPKTSAYPEVLVSEEEELSDDELLVDLGLALARPARCPLGLALAAFLALG